MPQARAKGKGKDKAKSLSPVELMHAAIMEKMHRAQHPSDMFICDHDLRNVWNHHNLKEIFPARSFDDDQRKKIMDKYLQVLSVLILIGWQGLPNQFRSHFLSRDDRADANLPLLGEKLSFLGISAWNFKHIQFAFIPAVIQERDERYVQKVDQSRRLPFIEKPSPIGTGGYGAVTKVNIAPRCLSDKANSKDNNRALAVACKKYTNQDTAENFQKELENLEFIKEALRGSRRVMKHIAAIVHGDDFMILLPLAELHDFEIFLRGGKEPQADTRDLQKIYDFDEEFPELADTTILHCALLKEVFEIASALLWLHSELRIVDSPDRYLAHMDLKPDNILLDKDVRMPAGKWMLSDFGVSLFEKSTNKKATAVHAIRDVGPRLTSRANKSKVMRGHGPYEPPEVNLETVDGRKCGVWSFGCILCDLLAFALGRTEAVMNLRGTRYDYEDDKFYRAQNSDTDRTKVINNSNTVLKPEVVTWLLSRQRTAYPWVTDYIAIVRMALVPDPSARQGIGEIMKGLSNLSEKMSPRTTSSGVEHSFPNPVQTSHHTGPFDSVKRGVSSEYPALTVWQPPAVETSRGSSVTILKHPGIPPSQNFKAKVTNEISSSGRSGSQGHKQCSSGFFRLLVSAPSQVRRPKTSDPPSRYLSAPEESGKQMTRSAGSNLGHIVDPTSHATPLLKSSQPDRSLSFGSFSTSQYQLEGQIDLKIPRKKRVIAIALAPSGNQAAFLFKHSACVFSTSSESKEIEEIDLPLDVDWRKIRLASYYLAVYGIAPSHEKQIEVRDLRKAKDKKLLPSSCRKHQASTVLLSSTGIAACVCGPSVLLNYLDNDEKQEICVDEGFIVKNADFSANGEVLCVLATGSFTNTAADHAYFYNTSMRPATVGGKGVYEKTAKASTSCNIWPYPSLMACVIREPDGSTFIAHDLSQPQSQIQQRNHIGIPSALVACVALNYTLICIEEQNWYKRQISEYQLQELQDKSWRIAKTSLKLGDAENVIAKDTEISAQVVEGKTELILCTTKGKILKYARTV